MMLLPPDDVVASLKSEQMAFFSWDLAADRLYGDGVLADLFQLEAAVLAAGCPILPLLERIALEDRGRVAKAIHQAITTGTLYQEHYRLLHPRKGKVRVIGAGRCLRDPNGVPSVYNGTVVELGGTADVPACSDVLEMHCRAALDLAEKRDNELAARYLSSALRVAGKPVPTTARF